MKFLVVGGDGVIGSAVVRRLTVYRGGTADLIITTRRSTADRYFLDLRDPPPADQYPEHDIVFLCAGINGFLESAKNPDAWRVNVDGVMSVARQAARRGAFIAYVSTAAVEWSNEPYAWQRRSVEDRLDRFDPAIFRPQRVTSGNSDEFAKFMIDIAWKRLPGLYRWPVERAAA